MLQCPSSKVGFCEEDGRVGKCHGYDGYIRVKSGLLILVRVKDSTFSNSGRWKGGFRRRFLPLQEMDVIKEFLESSTIHGISHISTSKVILRNGLSQNNIPFIDWFRQAFLDCCCYIWIYGSFCADQQFLFRMADIPNSHNHHHPPAEEPQLPKRDDLPPKGIPDICHERRACKNFG